MGTVITYKNDRQHCYCQVKLDSGERVLISIAQGGVKLLKLVLGGLVPGKTIWKSKDVSQVISVFLDEDARRTLRHPLDAIRDRLLTCPSIRELERLVNARLP
jgi:hypothetical protein